MHEEVKKFLKENGSKGGTNTWINKTPEERSKIMSKRRKMGWDKQQKRNKGLE